MSKLFIAHWVLGVSLKVQFRFSLFRKPFLRNLLRLAADEMSLLLLAPSSRLNGIQGIRQTHQHFLGLLGTWLKHASVQLHHFKDFGFKESIINISFTIIIISECLLLVMITNVFQVLKFWLRVNVTT